jgi:hypothetical protein
MGCINSKSLEEKKVNKQIEEKLAAEEKEKRREVKLLLLGIHSHNTTFIYFTNLYINNCYIKELENLVKVQ